MSERHPAFRATVAYVALALLAACAPDPEPPPAATVHEGLYVWGAEVRTFTPCSSQRDYWVDGAPDVADELSRDYQALGLPPYEPVFVRFEGALGARATDGFAADYDGTVRIDRLLEMRRQVPASCEDRPAGTPVDEPAAVTIVHEATLDTLHDRNGAVWILLSGVECTDCDAPESLYLRASAGEAGTLGPLQYPGERLEMGVEETPFERSRVYIGNCVPERGDEIVWFLETRNEAGEWIPDVRVLRVGNSGLASPALSLETMEAEVGLAVSAGVCSEIPGKRQYG